MGCGGAGAVRVSGLGSGRSEWHRQHRRQPVGSDIVAFLRACLRRRGRRLGPTDSTWGLACGCRSASRTGREPVRAFTRWAGSLLSLARSVPSARRSSAPADESPSSLANSRRAARVPIAAGSWASTVTGGSSRSPRSRSPRLRSSTPIRATRCQHEAVRRNHHARAASRALSALLLAGDIHVDDSGPNPTDRADNRPRIGVEQFAVRHTVRGRIRVSGA